MFLVELLSVKILYGEETEKPGLVKFFSYNRVIVTPNRNNWDLESTAVCDQ